MKPIERMKKVHVRLEREDSEDLSWTFKARGRREVESMLNTIKELCHVRVMKDGRPELKPIVLYYYFIPLPY